MSDLFAHLDGPLPEAVAPARPSSRDLLVKRHQVHVANGGGAMPARRAPRPRATPHPAPVCPGAPSGVDALAAFKEAHGAVWNWMDGSTFEFAVSLRGDLERYGRLTERQLAAAYRCIERYEAAKAEGQARRTTAPLDLGAIELAFNHARARTPKSNLALRFHGLVLSAAPAHGRNPGAIYAKAPACPGDPSGGRYLGKVVGGRFEPTRECTDADRATLLDVATDPLAKAVQYGRDVSICSCCGAALTDKVSIDRGIGPICAEKYGG